MTSRLDNISEELRCLIVQFCTPGSVKSLRLVARTFQSSTTRPIFDHVTVCLHPDSVNKLEQLARQPALADLVRHVTFHTAVLPSFAGQEEWEAEVDIRPPEHKFYHDFQQALRDKVDREAAEGRWLDTANRLTVRFVKDLGILLSNTSCT